MTWGFCQAKRLPPSKSLDFSHLPNVLRHDTDTDTWPVLIPTRPGWLGWEQAAGHVPGDDSMSVDIVRFPSRCGFYCQISGIRMDPCTLYDGFSTMVFRHDHVEFGDNITRIR